MIKSISERDKRQLREIYALIGIDPRLAYSEIKSYGWDSFPLDYIEYLGEIYESANEVLEQAKLAFEIINIRNPYIQGV